LSTKAASPVNVTGTGQVFAGPATYRGLFIRDTSGAANIVKLYNNNAASGTVVAAFQLAANADRSESVPTGVFCDKGLFLSATGAVEGSVRV
jgi:hypothetical protein